MISRSNIETPLNTGTLILIMLLPSFCVSLLNLNLFQPSFCCMQYQLSGNPSGTAVLIVDPDRKYIEADKELSKEILRLLLGPATDCVIIEASSKQVSPNICSFCQYLNYDFEAEHFYPSKMVQNWLELCKWFLMHILSTSFAYFPEGRPRCICFEYSKHLSREPQNSSLF